MTFRFTAGDARAAMQLREEINSEVVQVARAMCDEVLRTAASQHRTECVFQMPRGMHNMNAYNLRDVTIMLAEQLYQDGFDVKTKPDKGILVIRWTTKREVLLEHHKTNPQSKVDYREFMGPLFGRGGRKM